MTLDDYASSKPAPGKCIILPHRTKEERESGLVLSEGARPLTPMGEVLVYTPDRDSLGRDIEPEFNRGDTVLFDWTTCNVVTTDDKETIVFLRNADVMAVVS